MAKIRIIFQGSNSSETAEHSLEVFANHNKELFISIDMSEDPNDGAFIVLEKETAIKF